MRKELLCAAALAASVAVAPGAMAQVYLRIDGGGAISANTDLEDTNPTASNTTLGFDRFNGDLGTSPLGSAGIGYRISPSFRMDLTGSYVTPLDFRGTDALGLGATARAKPIFGLLNSYIDFAALAGMPASSVQPFLVFGLGASHTQLDTVTAASGVVIASGRTKTQFAWGIGGGVGFPLGRVVTFDVMYKYIDLGNAESASSVGGGTPVRIGIQLHTLTAGFRLEF